MVRPRLVHRLIRYKPLQTLWHIDDWGTIQLAITGEKTFSVVPIMHEKCYTKIGSVWEPFPPFYEERVTVQSKKRSAQATCQLSLTTPSCACEKSPMEKRSSRFSTNASMRTRTKAVPGTALLPEHVPHRSSSTRTGFQTAIGTALPFRGLYKFLKSQFESQP
jgi:hypothetical protein